MTQQKKANFRGHYVSRERTFRGHLGELALLESAEEAYYFSMKECVGTPGSVAGPLLAKGTRC